MFCRSFPSKVGLVVWKPGCVKEGHEVPAGSPFDPFCHLHLIFTYERAELMRAECMRSPSLYCQNLAVAISRALRSLKTYDL